MLEEAGGRGGEKREEEGGGKAEKRAGEGADSEGGDGEEFGRDGIEEMGEDEAGDNDAEFSRCWKTILNVGPLAFGACGILSFRNVSKSPVKVYMEPDLLLKLPISNCFSQTSSVRVSPTVSTSNANTSLALSPRTSLLVEFPEGNSVIIAASNLRPARVES